MLENYVGKIELWFPVAIYVADDLFSQQQNEIWKDCLLNLKKNKPSGGADWYGNTYTTHDSYDLREEEKFKSLLDKITDCVQEFANAHNSTGQYNCEHFWANIALEKNYQEFHTHDGSIFSAVYYIEVPEGSGSIVFNDPKQPDMLPIKNINERNHLSFIRTKYLPKAGRLLIFRSYLSHMVEPGTNSSERISVSLNFG